MQQSPVHDPRCQISQHTIRAQQLEAFISDLGHRPVQRRLIDERSFQRRDLTVCSRHCKCPFFLVRTPHTKNSTPPGPSDSLIIGLNRSAIGTVVERTSRHTLLVHLPRLTGHGVETRTKNGPALGGYGAVAMKDALEPTIGSMPAALRRSLAWDREQELSALALAARHEREHQGTVAPILPPKGTDLSRWDTKTFSPSKTPQTADPAKSSDGKPRPKP